MPNKYDKQQTLQSNTYFAQNRMFLKRLKYIVEVTNVLNVYLCLFSNYRKDFEWYVPYSKKSTISLKMSMT